MSSSSLIRVNQKLAQAKILLAEAVEITLTPIHLNSLKEAVAFHLVCAYRHYLHEIAESYWLKNTASILTEVDLMAAFVVAKKHPADVEELISYRKVLHSWLSQLHAYYESLWLAPVASSSESQSSDDLIKIVNLESDFDVAVVDLALMTAWHQEFTAIVTRQRDTRAEF